MNAKTEVIGFLSRLRQGGMKPVFPCATPRVLSWSEEGLGCEIPCQCREFLVECNGVITGRDAIYGVHYSRSDFSILTIYQDVPRLEELCVLPIAGDGCGNHFVIERNSGEVLFYESLDGNLPYIVASDFWHFAWFFIAESFGGRGWPSEKEYVVRHDPAISIWRNAPPLWELD